MELEIAVSPEVDERGVGRGAEAQQVGVVVSPERAEAAADGAVALGDLGRRFGDFDADGAAVTRGGEHGPESTRPAGLLTA